jgi:hypothetical protein
LKIYDSAGNDRTSTLASYGLTVEHVPASETGNVEKYWRLKIDKTKEGANSYFMLGKNYGVVCIIAYMVPSLPPTSWTPVTKITPMAMMPEQAKLIDMTAITMNIEMLVALVDPLLKTHFWGITTGAILSVFGFIPGGILLANITLFLKEPILYFSMFFVTLPSTWATAIYFIILWAMIGPTVWSLLMAAAPAELTGG